MRFSERCAGVLLLLMLALAGCDAKSDLVEVCQAFSSLEKQPALASMSHADRMRFVDEHVAPQLSRFSKVRALWELLPNYESEARYRMFKRGADELVGKWDCPEMERLAPTLSEPAMGSK